MNVDNLNPLLIMAINMAIVFSVLISLGILMKVIYWVDPTRKKKKACPAQAAGPSAASVNAPKASAQQDEGEVVAVIAAAVMAMGYRQDQIASIRPTASRKWIMEGRLSGRL